MANHLTGHRPIKIDTFIGHTVQNSHYIHSVHVLPSVTEGANYFHPSGLGLSIVKTLKRQKWSKVKMAMTQGTPESDFSIECFQNYTAPEVFIQGLAGIVDQQDVETMIRAQKQMLQRFEKTNEMLTNCNALSASRLKTVGPEFKKHTQLLIEMKKDLDYIFKKIRLIKTKLSTQYPQEFAEAQRNSLAEEAEEDDDFKKSDAKKEDTKSNEETASTSETIKSDRDKTETNDNASEKRKSFKSSKSSSTDSNTNDFSHSSTESP